MDQLLQLIKVQLWQFFREPSVLFWGIVFPVLMSWGLGVAFTKIGSVKHQIAVVEDSTGFSPLDSLLQKTATKFSKPLNKTVYSFTEHNEKTGDIEFVFCKTQADSAIVLMKRDLVSLMIREKNDKLSFEFDPQNSGSNLTYLHLTDILYNQSRKRTDELVEPLTLKGTRYIDFLIPGIIAMRIMSSALWGIGWTLIDTRSKKLLRRMIATPMKKSYYLVSHFIARLFLSVCEASLLFIFSYFYFGISIQGSILDLPPYSHHVPL